MPAGPAGLCRRGLFAIAGPRRTVQPPYSGPCNGPATLGSRKLFWFLCGWLGGPDHYVERFGHPRLRARHLPFKIGIKERDQWVACMGQAMAECGLDPALRERLTESFMGTADWMRNQPSAVQPPP